MALQSPTSSGCSGSRAAPARVCAPPKTPSPRHDPIRTRCWCCSARPRSSIFRRPIEPRWDSAGWPSPPRPRACSLGSGRRPPSACSRTAGPTTPRRCSATRSTADATSDGGPMATARALIRLGRGDVCLARGLLDERSVNSAAPDERPSRLLHAELQFALDDVDDAQRTVLDERAAAEDHGRIADALGLEPAARALVGAHRTARRRPRHPRR